MDTHVSWRFTASVRVVVTSLRRRFLECRRDEAPLSTWRELQLDILAVAKTLQHNAHQDARAALWQMLGDAFWLDSDPTRLAHKIEQVIDELERHDLS